jgi:hypothetical protein
MKYLIDSNVFITASRGFYSFAFGSAFWDFLLQEAQNNRVASIDKVLDEINKGNDELKSWANKKFSDYFLNTKTEQVLEQYARLMQWAETERAYKQIAIDEFMEEDNADTWLIAYAMTDPKEYKLVTFEKPNNDIKRKIPIPNVCKHFQIGYCDLYEMLKDLKFKF